MEGIYHGHEGWRRYWEQWAEAWSESHIVPEEIVDFPDRLLVLSRLRSRARVSGLEMDEPLAHLLTFSEGAAVRHEEWFSHAEGMKAAGLAP
jgi:hypothetical protein